MDKDVKRVGVIVTDFSRILVCEPYGYEEVDIPKGHLEIDEPLALGAVREMREETGITCDPHNIVFFKSYPYHEGTLYLYVLPVSQLPDKKDLLCTAFFKDRITGRMHPEMKGYKYISDYSEVKFYYPLQAPMKDVFHALKDFQTLIAKKESAEQ